MAGITQVTGSTTIHVTAQLSKSATDIYDSVAVAVTGSLAEDGFTGAVQQITLALVSKGYGIPTDVILALGSTPAHAATVLSGSYSNTSALVDIAVATLGSDNGSTSETVLAALIKKEGTY